MEFYTEYFETKIIKTTSYSDSSFLIKVKNVLKRKPKAKIIYESIINSKIFDKISKKKLSSLIKNFYNDTYLVDQNACSSPHLILWYGGQSLLH
jgi:hypothetical protein